MDNRETETETEPRHPLLQAVLDGDLRLLKEMAGVVAADVGVRARALSVAAMEGRLDICMCLVEDHGVDVNQLTFTGDTALAISASYGTPAITRYLLDRGAVPTLVGALWPPLHAATSNGQCEIVKMLLSTGIDVDHFDPEYGTALHVAATSGQDGSMNILLQHHADPNKVFRLQSTPLSMAIISESLECVKLLIKAGADVNRGSSLPMTPLVFATGWGGYTNFVKFLLKAGADPNIPDAYGKLPVELAAKRDCMEEVEMLFPLTSPIPTIPNWSIDGIISHAKFENAKPLDGRQLEQTKATLKSHADHLFRLKDYKVASKAYGVAIDVAPSATLYVNRSLCKLLLDDGEGALSDALRCRMLRPNWAKACYRQAAAHMLLKEYKQACDALLDAQKLDPGNIEVERELRKARELMKAHGEADK